MEYIHTKNTDTQRLTVSARHNACAQHRRIIPCRSKRHTSVRQHNMHVVEYVRMYTYVSVMEAHRVYSHAMHVSDDNSAMFFSALVYAVAAVVSNTFVMRCCAPKWNEVGVGVVCSVPNNNIIRTAHAHISSHVCVCLSVYSRVMCVRERRGGGNENSNGSNSSSSTTTSTTTTTVYIFIITGRCEGAAYILYPILCVAMCYSGNLAIDSTGAPTLHVLVLYIISSVRVCVCVTNTITACNRRAHRCKS